KHSLKDSQIHIEPMKSKNARPFFLPAISVYLYANLVHISYNIPVVHQKVFLRDQKLYSFEEKYEFCKVNHYVHQSWVLQLQAVVHVLKDLLISQEVLH